MKYILIFLLRSIRFIVCAILHLITWIFLIIWSGKFGYDLHILMDQRNNYEEWYEDLWDVAIGRLTFKHDGYSNWAPDYIKYSFCIGSKGYVTVKGKTKPFTYKV